MIRALLIGREPAAELGYSYVTEGPYEAVVIGSLTISQLLRFREERVLQALAEGKPVHLYTPGLPQVSKTGHWQQRQPQRGGNCKAGAWYSPMVPRSSWSPPKTPGR